MMNINQAVDEVRRSEWNKASIEKKKVIKNSRYLLLSKKSKLENSKLNRLAALIKEQFSCVYEQADEEHSNSVQMNGVRWHNEQIEVV